MSSLERRIGELEKASNRRGERIEMTDGDRQVVIDALKRLYLSELRGEDYRCGEYQELPDGDKGFQAWLANRGAGEERP